MSSTMFNLSQVCVCVCFFNKGDFSCLTNMVMSCFFQKCVMSNRDGWLGIMKFGKKKNGNPGTFKPTKILDLIGA